MSKSRIKILVTLVPLLFGVLSTQMVFGKRPYLGLAGLTKTHVHVFLSEDVKKQMSAIGAGNFIISGELAHLVESKLKAIGISPSGDSESGPTFNLLVDIDMSTDEFTVTGNYSDLVSLVREPGTKFETVLWSKTLHPATDDTDGLKTSVNNLMDQFEIDCLAASKKEKR